jgi:hypothetical protein
MVYFVQSTLLVGPDMDIYYNNCWNFDERKNYLSSETEISCRVVLYVDDLW